MNYDKYNDEQILYITIALKQKRQIVTSVANTSKEKRR